MLLSSLLLLLLDPINESLASFELDVDAAKLDISLWSPPVLFNKGEFEFSDKPSKDFEVALILQRKC